MCNLLFRKSPNDMAQSLCLRIYVKPEFGPGVFGFEFLKGFDKRLSIKSSFHWFTTLPVEKILEIILKPG
jgi:hypothetical protein